MKYADLGNYLVSAPLYQTAEIEDPKLQTYEGGHRALRLPDEVRRDCTVCGGERNFERIGGVYEGTVGTGFFERKYRCKDCEKETLHVWFHWAWATERPSC